MKNNSENNTGDPENTGLSELRERFSQKIMVALKLKNENSISDQALQALSFYIEAKKVGKTGTKAIYALSFKEFLKKDCISIYGSDTSKSVMEKLFKSIDAEIGGAPSVSSTEVKSPDIAGGITRGKTKAP